MYAWVCVCVYVRVFLDYFHKINLGRVLSMSVAGSLVTDQDIQILMLPHAGEGLIGNYISIKEI